MGEKVLQVNVYATTELLGEISFVCWKWHAAIAPRAFLAEHVNVLRAMIARWYAKPFRFICVTDDARGLGRDIEVLPLPVRFDTLKNPHGKRFPNCYCRLWNFSREAVAVLGKRIFQLDIDVVITGDLSPLVDRKEDFVGWCDKRFQKNKIAGGAYLLKTGSMPHIWEEFNPKTSPTQAFAAGNMGSDQGWMSFKLFPPPGKWVDGLVKINWTPSGSREPPSGARMVFTNGLTPPWDKKQQSRYPWIAQFWKK